MGPAGILKRQAEEKKGLSTVVFLNKLLTQKTRKGSVAFLNKPYFCQKKSKSTFLSPQTSKVRPHPACNDNESTTHERGQEAKESDQSIRPDTSSTHIA